MAGYALCRQELLSQSYVNLTSCTGPIVLDCQLRYNACMAISRVVSNRFRNEKGNDIYVRASEEPVHGVPGILLYIAGPDSDSEMHVTREEGLELFKLLTKLLKPGRRSM